MIGTRRSRLAVIQTEIVKSGLERRYPDRKFQIKTIKTTGDLISDLPLNKINEKGLFIKELELALLNDEIDLAIHSMKDVPTLLPVELKLGAVLKREQPWDVVICSVNYSSLKEASTGFRIGSSSLRRKAQLIHSYPHLDIQPIRGNLDTRLRKLNEGLYDGIVLAYAGVVRMGWLSLISEVLPADTCLPAVGQGAIGIEIRNNDAEVAGLVASLNCPSTEAAVTAERAFLSKLEGGCQVPVGALATCDGDELKLEGMVASLDGEKIIRAKLSGFRNEAEQIGFQLAEKMLQQGCGTILDQIRQECE